MTITKTKYNFTNKPNTNLKFIHSNDKLLRIYFKNKKKDKENNEIFFFNIIDNSYILESINNQSNEKFDTIGGFIYFLDKKENMNIFFKDIETIENLNIEIIKTPRNNHLFTYKEKHKIIAMQEFFFLNENEFKNVISIKEKYLNIINVLKLKELEKYGSIFDYVIHNGLKKIVNKISYVNKDLDLNFLETMQHGWGEVFKLLENRNNKKIIAIDINSMFPFCMTQKNYTEINKIKLITDLDKQTEIDYLKLILEKKINNGISVVDMKLKETLTEKEIEFIENFNFFLINKLGNNYSYNGFKDTNIQRYIHNSEIQVLSKYFDFTIKEMVYSENSIEHYLSDTVKKFYEYRIEENDEITKKIIKTMLVAYHSITNKNQMKKHSDKFSNKIKAVNYFKHYLKYGVINDFSKFYLYKNKNVEGLYIENVRELENKEIIIDYRIPMTGRTTQIYSLPSQIMSNSRVHIFQIIEKVFFGFNEVFPSAKAEICYTNIDSLHISINEENIEDFKNYFKEELNKNILGKFKIEGIFDTGLWFDPGRYWLLNKTDKITYTVEQFKSMVFKSENPWIRFKKIPVIDQYGSLIEKKHYIFTSTNYNKLFYKRSDTNIILKKFNIDKILEEKFILFIEKLILKNYPLKKECFEYFSKRSKKNLKTYNK